MGFFGPTKREKELQSELEALRVEYVSSQKEIKRLKTLMSPEQNSVEALNMQISTLQNELDNKVSSISIKNHEIFELDSKKKSLECELVEMQKQLIVTRDDIFYQDFALYRPNYVFANSDLYKDMLNQIRDKQKEHIKNDTACYGSSTWTVNGNATKGRAMVKDTKKLLLRAFNVECDDIVNNVRVSNLDKSIERIEKISSQISKLGEIMSISITPQYIRLKIEEVKLALDFQQKKQEEKEKLKELKAQQREEAKVQKEIEEERKKLKKEQKHYETALLNILALIEKNGENQELIDKKIELENQLSEIGTAIENVDYREANKKAGYVYIISNIGAFGEGVYKIGMTRRLDPMERIDELGDASVPFDFDVHALIFSEDAPQLESALHNAFADKKVNRINMRREFFKVPLEDIKKEVRKNFDKTVEWVDVPEAEQYRQSKAYETMNK